MRYGLFASAFSPFPHPGHLLIMSQAVGAGACDKIVALIHDDPTLERAKKIKPPLTVLERQICLSPLKYMARTIPYKTESELEHIYRIAARNHNCCIIVGEEYRDSEYIGKHMNIPVFFPKSPPWRGTEISERVAFAYASYLDQ
jgi:glycerol-3-phosphate cytidylyltransferase-like family protein